MSVGKIALIDASSAILLYKAQLFESVAKAFAVRMVPEVFQEVTVAGRSGSAFFRRCAERSCLVLGARTNGSESRFDQLHIGERHTILAYLEGGADFIIIDDRKGALVCRAERIPYINALLCPRIMQWAGHITPGASNRAFRRIERAGRYGDAIITFARMCTARQMAHFIP